eukprot:scaffold5981_cov141-Isochrysis_galbana.AAC.3
MPPCELAPEHGAFRPFAFPVNGTRLAAAAFGKLVGQCQCRPPGGLATWPPIRLLHGGREERAHGQCPDHGDHWTESRGKEAWQRPCRAKTRYAHATERSPTAPPDLATAHQAHSMHLRRALRRLETSVICCRGDKADPH